MNKFKELDIKPNPNTTIHVLDEPGAGGACHEYCISRSRGWEKETEPFGGSKLKRMEEPPIGEFGHVHFQNGPIKENGVNGCHQEDLLAIVIDRLRSFQAGDFACRENAIALTKLEEALMWLNKRTADRVKRGVEGTNVR